MENISALQNSFIKLRHFYNTNYGKYIDLSGIFTQLYAPCLAAQGK